MAKYSNAQGNFLGGMWSQQARGRFDDPDYKIALSECLNMYPIEEGPVIRRPGWKSLGYTHLGRPAKLLPLAGEETVQYNIELTEGNLRILNGMSVLSDGNQKKVVTFGTDDPATITTDVPHEWATGDSVGLAFQSPAAQFYLAAASNRIFIIEVVDSLNFRLHDYITGKGFDGSTVTWSSDRSVTVAKLLVLQTNYINGQWAKVHHVQSDQDTLLLHPTVPPQRLTMTQAGPISMLGTTLTTAEFVDGPYLDAVNGAILTPDALSGVVNFTITFAVYSATAVYNIGDVVADSNGVYHISITDANINNDPTIDTTHWTTTSPAGFINNGLGVLPSDAGRHIRFYSEPPDWASAANYTAGNVVKYPSGPSGAYWAALKSMTGATPSAGDINPNQPGNDPTTWAPNATASIWTWGKIVTGDTAPKLSFVGAPFGTMTGNAGLAGLLGTTLYAETAAPSASAKNAYCGFHFTTPAAVSSARLLPATRNGGASQNGTGGGGILGGIGLVPGVNIFGIVPIDGGRLVNLPTPNGNSNAVTDYTFARLINANARVTLYGKSTLPASGTDGTKLGSTTVALSALTVGGALVTSNDNVTTWAYLWFYIEIFPVQDSTVPADNDAYNSATIVASEMAFYGAGSAGTHAGSAFSAQIIGDPLKYVRPIALWRMGRYNASEPTWPTLGAYIDGRFFLADQKTLGHFDASMAGQTFVFSPTEPDGTVTAASGISYTFNTKVKAPFKWMFSTEDGVLFGTSAGEFLVSAPGQGAISVDNITDELTTSFGSSAVEPVQAPHAILFVHKNTHDVFEYMRDLYSGKLTAKSLSARSKGLSKGGIVQAAFQNAVSSILWAITATGDLIGTTYKRETRLAFSPPTYNGWHRHNHGADRFFLSISTGPSRRTGLETPIVVTQSKKTGLCRNEAMGDILEEDATIFDCAFLDGQLVQTSGIVGGLPGHGSQVFPTPPPPPPTKAWSVPGFHLTSTCPADAFLPPYGSVPPPTGVQPANTTLIPSGAEPALDASGFRTVCYVSPPCTMAFGGCGSQGFTAAGVIPGVGAFLPVAGQGFVTVIYTGDGFGSWGWRLYQSWSPDTPGTGSPTQPTWS